MTFPITDTGFLRDWKLIKIEGEEPVPDETVEQQSQFASNRGSVGKGTDRNKKPPPGKGNNKIVVLEEITDNRPRTISYSKDFAEENNGFGLEVTEEVAINFSKAIL